MVLKILREQQKANVSKTEELVYRSKLLLKEVRGESGRMFLGQQWRYDSTLVMGMTME